MSLNQADIIGMMQDFDNKAWAEKSRFYNTVMRDGNIFNPYIHRRWVPAQFNRIINEIGIRRKGYRNDFQPLTCSDINYYFSNKKEIEHCFDILYKEVELLSYLKRKDKIAFEERSAIYTLESCKNIYKGFWNWMLGNREMSDAACYRAPLILRQAHFYEGLYKDEFKPMLMSVLSQIETVSDYEELANLLQTVVIPCNRKRLEVNWGNIHKFLNWPLNFNLVCRRSPDYPWVMNLISKYVLTGAYYSLKTEYMFNPKVKSTIKCQIIQNELMEGKDWKGFMREYCSIKGYAADIK